VKLSLYAMASVNRSSSFRFPVSVNGEGDAFRHRERFLNLAALRGRG
jgi:hypothetical protein